MALQLQQVNETSRFAILLRVGVLCGLLRSRLAVGLVLRDIASGQILRERQRGEMGFGATQRGVGCSDGEQQSVQHSLKESPKRCLKRFTARRGMLYQGHRARSTWQRRLVVELQCTAWPIWLQRLFDGRRAGRNGEGVEAPPKAHDIWKDARRRGFQSHDR